MATIDAQIYKILLYLNLNVPLFVINKECDIERLLDVYGQLTNGKS